MITIIIPVIRQKMFECCFQAIKENHGLDNIPFDVLAKIDRESIGCPKMVKELVSLTKPEYPWICFLGDDTIPQPGFLKQALLAHATLIDQWGVVGINDQTNRLLPTHWLAHKNMLELLDGEFFYTGYKHCFCDNELMERSMMYGKFNMAWNSRVFHDHPLLKGEKLEGEYDEIYRKNFEHDRELFLRRRENGWKS